MSKLEIRPLEQNDFPAWLPFWDDNNLGVRNEEVTTETWSRLIDPDYPVHGLCALKDGTLAGFVHYVIHPTTGSIAPICYMQDVYTDPALRRQGIAKALIEELAKIGRQEKWGRIYWLAETGNEAAQTLYKNIGVKLDFTLHVMPLN